MIALRAVLLILGALAVLALGAAPASAARAPACHGEASAPAHGQPAHAPASTKALPGMACCVACVAAPRPELPAIGGIALPRAVFRAATPAPFNGSHPEIEPGPPRA